MQHIQHLCTGNLLTGFQNSLLVIQNLTYLFRFIHIQTCQRCSRSHKASTAYFSGSYGQGMSSLVYCIEFTTCYKILPICSVPYTHYNNSEHSLLVHRESLHWFIEQNLLLDTKSYLYVLFHTYSNLSKMQSSQTASTAYFSDIQHSCTGNLFTGFQNSLLDTKSYLSVPFHRHSNLSKMQSFSYSEHSLLLRYSCTGNLFTGLLRIHYCYKI